MSHQHISVSIAINHFGLIDAPQLIRKLTNLLMSKDFGEVWVFSWDKGCPFILPGDDPNYQLKPNWPY